MVRGALSLLVSFCLLLLVTTEAFATPAVVIIIRHGEKNETGNHLNAKGWKRAEGLKAFFRDNPDMKLYQKQSGKIAKFYAMEPKDIQGTYRPIETLTPTAKLRGMPIDSQFKRGQEEALAADIMNDSKLNGRVVVICWEHNYIQNIEAAFGIHHPDQWAGGDVFDRAIVLPFNQDHKIDIIRDIPQQVLKGDSGPETETVRMNRKKKKNCNILDIF